MTKQSGKFVSQCNCETSDYVVNFVLTELPEDQSYSDLPQGFVIADAVFEPAVFLSFLLSFLLSYDEVPSRLSAEKCDPPDTKLDFINGRVNHLEVRATGLACTFVLLWIRWGKYQG